MRHKRQEIYKVLPLLFTSVISVYLLGNVSVNVIVS